MHDRFLASRPLQVYALEPDPTAYQQVYWNVKANPHIAAKVTVLNLCISNTTGGWVDGGQRLGRRIVSLWLWSLRRGG